jgi:hypothetical protein
MAVRMTAFKMEARRQVGCVVGEASGNAIAQSSPIPSAAETCCTKQGSPCHISDWPDLHCITLVKTHSSNSVYHESSM